MQRINAQATFTDLTVADFGGPKATAFFKLCDTQIPFARLADSVAGIFKDDNPAGGAPHWPVITMIKVLFLILLDMHLPDISGLDLLRHLKGDPQTANIPIVVVSADALAQQISDALEAGAERYLTKPVSVGELLAVLDDLLDRIDTAFS